MDPSHFATLRDKLLHGTDFIAVWEYFLDHVADDPEFDAGGQRTRSELLEPVFERYCLSAVKAAPPPGRVLLVRYGPAQFIHGGAMVGRLLVNVMFFEDLQAGLFSVTDPTGRQKTVVSRFSLKPMPGSANPDRN